MGLRGAAGRPEEQKILDGERPQRLNPSAPKLPHAWPEPPEDISPEALQIWEELKTSLSQASFITHADRDQLRAYVDTVARYREANQLLRSTGMLIPVTKPCPKTCQLCDSSAEGHTGTYIEVWRKNPLVTVVHELTNQIRAMAREFGLTPSARSGIVDLGRVPKQGDGPKTIGGVGEFTD